MAPTAEVSQYQAIGYEVEVCSADQLAEAPAFQRFICEVPRSSTALKETLTRKLGLPPHRICASVTAALATE